VRRSVGPCLVGVLDVEELSQLCGDRTFEWLQLIVAVDMTVITAWQ
jgi:hypothetical protein